jgi:predicted DNA-binding protein
MSTKVRKQIYIEAEQEAVLKRLAKETGISEAEIIRQAIDRYAQSLQYPRRDFSAWERMRSRIGQLIALGSVPGGRTWRREDLYE